jgi:shikimate kinase
VVSCGGGLVCDEENLRILKETGTVFNLKASAQILYERTKKHKHRPLVNVEDPLSKIEELLKKREPYYNQAHYSIETEGIAPLEVANRIINILGNIF